LHFISIGNGRADSAQLTKQLKVLSVIAVFGSAHNVRLKFDPKMTVLTLHSNVSLW
jgi:hypothetical protein